MKNFYIADLHLFHNSVLKDGKFHERPFETLDEMNQAIMNNWNRVVTNGDTVYLLGDIAHKANANETAEFLSQLKGKIILITGNHDRIKDQKIRKQLSEIYTYKECVDYIKGKAIQVVLCHYPIFSWNGQFRGAIHLYGHVHDNEDDQLYQDAINNSNRHFAIRDGERHKDFQAYNVGCMKDYMNYTPRTLEEILIANNKIQ